MQVEPIDLGICPGYVYAGDPARVAIVLPGAMLGGMPVNGIAIATLVARGWTVVQVWDEFRDRSLDQDGWVRVRAEAALRWSGDPQRLLLVAKSLSTRAAGLAAARRIPAIWLTPLLNEEAVLRALRASAAPMLLVGGTDDPSWDGRLARELSADVLELPGADHGFGAPDGEAAGLLENLGRVAAAVDAFAGRLS